VTTHEILVRLASPKLWPLYVLLASALYIQRRGKVKLPFSRQITDHSTFMAPYNALMYLCSAVPTTPFLDPALFPQLGRLREHWRTFRDEAQALYASGEVRAADGYTDLAFNSFFRTGWKRFYVKWYDEPLPSARSLCPRTVALLESVPGIHAAMFALMGPRSRLLLHRDPFAGSLRYHLGLATPGSERCHIEIDGTTYVWRDGEDVLFDETYLHSAENDTDEPRIILFCDVERPLRFAPVRALNRFVVRRLAKATATRNREGDRLGVFNKLFGGLYQVRVVAKRFKAWNKTAYYALKYVGIAGLLYGIFLR
jgi:beta-hydroxylase